MTPKISPACQEPCASRLQPWRRIRAHYIVFTCSHWLRSRKPQPVFSADVSSNCSALIVNLGLEPGLPRERFFRIDVRGNDDDERAWAGEWSSCVLCKARARISLRESHDIVGWGPLSVETPTARVLVRPRTQWTAVLLSFHPIFLCCRQKKKNKHLTTVTVLLSLQSSTMSCPKRAEGVDPVA